MPSKSITFNLICTQLPEIYQNCCLCVFISSLFQNRIFCSGSLDVGKDSDAGRDLGQEEKGTTEDEMAGWHH